MTRKKVLSLMLSLLMILCLVPAGALTASAAETYGDFSYTVSGGEVTITAYNGEAASVTVPSAINGSPVTKLGSEAFYNKSTLTSVSIPEGVREIGSNCFQHCGNLTSVSLPAGLEVIGEYAFNYAGMSTISIPDSVTTIQRRAFSGCAELRSFVFPENALTLGNEIFYGCSKLQSVRLPANLKKIPSSCFTSCADLTSVNIPENLETIGSGAFSTCKSLAPLSLPDSVTSIEAQAFRNCEGFESFVLPPHITEIPYQLFYGSSNLKTVTIPDGVTSIGGEAFKQTGLTSVEIPDSVKSIGAGAFQDCRTLGSVNLPPDLTAIPNDAFNNCFNNLAENVTVSLTIPEGVTSIGSNAFQNCTKLVSVELPENLVSIGNDAFRSTGITSIVIPNQVRAIPQSCFSSSNLTEVTIPKSVTSIGYFAFGFLDDLATVHYLGTEEEWNQIVIDNKNDGNSPLYTAAKEFQKIYTVTLLPGEGAGEPAVYRSDEGAIADDWESAEFFQFYYSGPDGDTVYFKNGEPEDLGFTAPADKAFMEWRETEDSTEKDRIFEAAWHYVTWDNVPDFAGSVSAPDSVTITKPGTTEIEGTVQLTPGKIEISEEGNTFFDFIKGIRIFSSIEEDKLIDESTGNSLPVSVQNDDTTFYGNGTVHISLSVSAEDFETAEFGTYTGTLNYYIGKVNEAGAWLNSGEEPDGSVQVAVTVENHTVTFDANGGTGEMDPMTVKGGGTVTLPACGFTAPEGSVFKGWNTTPGGAGKWYDPEDPFEISENTTLYARWGSPSLSVCSYDVTNSADAKGGRFFVLSEYITGEKHYGGCNYGANLGMQFTLTAYPDNGYRFKGWYKGKYIGETDSNTQVSRPLDVNDQNNLLSDELEYTFSLNDNAVICPVFEAAPEIHFVDIGNVWTNLDPIHETAFTGEINPNEDGLADFIELEEEVWTDEDGESILRKSEPGTPVLGKTYQYTAIVSAKGENTFVPDGFRFVYGGTEYDWEDIEVSVSEDHKKAAITGFVKPVTVEAADISGAAVSGIKDKTYNGKAQTQSPTVVFDGITLTSGTDYTLSYKNNTNAGTATVTVTGKGNCKGSVSKTFKIKPKAITPTVTLSAASFAYTGSAQKPAVTVKDGTTTLKSGTDYTVTWPSNVTAVGAKSVKVTLKGNYSGTKTVSYKIVPARPTVPAAANAAKGLKITWKKTAGAGGYRVYRSTDSGKTYKLAKTVGASTLTWTDTAANTNGSKYLYKILAYKTVSGTNYNSAYSAVRTYYKVAQPAAPALANSTKGKLTVTWKKNAKASGYKIKYVTGTTTKTVTVKGSATVKKVLAVTKGKTYKVSVMAYKTVSGVNYNSTWSPVKSLKITK